MYPYDSAQGIYGGYLTTGTLANYPYNLSVGTEMVKFPPLTQPPSVVPVSSEPSEFAWLRKRVEEFLWKE